MADDVRVEVRCRACDGEFGRFDCRQCHGQGYVAHSSEKAGGS